MMFTAKFNKYNNSVIIIINIIVINVINNNGILRCAE